MGFFSRFFKIREQDPDSAETTWAMEDNGSELVLDPEYAATLMTELDLDAFPAPEELWRRWCRIIQNLSDSGTTVIRFGNSNVDDHHVYGELE
jgi:hypothetical protein